MPEFKLPSDEEAREAIKQRLDDLVDIIERVPFSSNTHVAPSTSVRRDAAERAEEPAVQGLGYLGGSP